MSQGKCLPTAPTVAASLSIDLTEHRGQKLATLYDGRAGARRPALQFPLPTNYFLLMNELKMPQRAMVLLFVLAGFTVAKCSTTFAADRPNIVWIVSEDNSIHYLEHFFEGGAPAPNIEAMATHGLTFNNAFSNAPVCSVARTTLATACYGPRIGTQFHRRYAMAPMPQGLRMFPAYLRDAGYYTTNNSKKDYNAVEGKGVWDASSRNASWRNRPKQDQPFFHMQSHAQSHEGSLHFNRGVFENDKTKTDPNQYQTCRLSPRHAIISLHACPLSRSNA